MMRAQILKRSVFSRLTRVRFVSVLFLGCIALAVATSSSRAQSGNLDAILAIHLEAHGGASAWENVTSIKMEGVFEAFSAEAPFTIYRQRPHSYHFDHQVLGTPAVLAYDGKKPWVRSAAYGAPQGMVLTAAEGVGANVLHASPFGCPLLALQQDGADMTLVGRVPQEGHDYWQVDITDGDGHSVESWYLDVDTGLEFKRVGQTYDIFSGGIQMEMETYYSDFRQQGEVLLAFREERHFGTRYHVIQAESVTLNPDIGAGLFRVPDGAAEQPASQGER